MRIAFVGEEDDGLSVSSHHARALAHVGENVFFDTHAERLAGPHLDAVHLVTCGQYDDRLLRNVLALRAAQIPVLRFWTGRDLLWATYHEPSRVAAQALHKAGVHQYCRTEAANRSLVAIDIASEIVPMFSANLSSLVEPKPLPQQFTALCRLPGNRREYCGGVLIDQLIRWMPRVRFLILGDLATDYSAFRHVESLGMVEDITRAIQRSTVLIQARLDESPSRLMLEALSLGRHVVTNCKWPHCVLADSVDAFMAALRGLQREVVFNLPGREAVCRGHDCGQLTAMLLGLLQRAQELGGLSSTLRAAWQATVASGEFTGIANGRFSPPDPSRLPEEAAAFRALVAPQPASAA